MKQVSEEFKKLARNIKMQDVKLGIMNGELTVKEISMMSVKAFNATPVWMLRARKKVISKEVKYSFDGELFKTIMQEIDIKVKNASEIKDKWINFQYGIMINNTFEYVDMGNYYIKDIEDSKAKSEITATGYDKMLNFMKTFKQSELNMTYPCTILELVQKMGEICDVELYNTDFFNYDLSVDEDFFTEQQLTYRDALEKVCQATLTTAFIKENKLYFCKVTTGAAETLDDSIISELVIKEKFGPLNALVLGRGSVEDNVESKDDESIEQNGRCEIRFDENEFVEYKREQVIDSMFNQINGLDYYAFESSNIGVVWLEPCDFIILKDSEENEYNSYYLKADITFTLGISGNAEASILEETNTAYKVTTKEEKKTLKVERLAKKNEGLIQDVISQQTETDTTVSEHTHTIEKITESITKTDKDNNKKFSDITTEISKIRQEVGDVTDVTILNEGTGSLTFENVNSSEPIYIEIHPVSTDISYLYPRDNLYPADDLYPLDRQLVFTNTTTNEVFTYELPDDLLYYDKDTYDELIMDYENQTCKVIKRVSIDDEENKSKLSTEVTTTYDYPTIALTTGNYTIKLNCFTDSYFKIRLMSQNMYTSQYATKVEMNSSITATTNELNLKVAEKLDSSEFTSANIVLKINNDESSALISADKVNLQGYVTVTDLKGSGTTTINGSNITTGTIDASKVTVKNLSANNITSGTLKSSNYVSGSAGTSINLSTGAIDTKNFKVDSSGNITANSGKIGGWTVNGQAIFNGKGIGTSGSVGMSCNISNWAFWAGNGVFKVTPEGALTATNATISGKITATSGSIAGVQIDTYGMYYNNDENSTGWGLWGTIANAGIVFHAGSKSNNIGGAPFKVYHDGSVYMEKGAISGSMITTGTIDASKVTVSNINASNITSGTLNIHNGSTYYLRMGFGTSNPEVSGLNVGTKGFNVNSGCFIITSGSGETTSYIRNSAGGLDNIHILDKSGNEISIPTTSGTSSYFSFYDILGVVKYCRAHGYYTG